MSVEIHTGNCLDILPALDPVQCIVTSPPYYALRDYGIAPSLWPEIRYSPMIGLAEIVIPAQESVLGMEKTLDAYIGHLVHVFRLARTVLADDGLLWLNLGDSYATDTTSPKQGATGQRANRTFTAAGMPPKGSGLLNKNLLMVPSRAALALQADGWILRSDIIWAKPAPMPESVTDRPTKSHEHLFLFAKQGRYFYDAGAIREGDHVYTRKAGGYHDDVGTRLDGQYRNKGGIADKDTTTIGRNKRDVWTISTNPYSGAHFAVMPSALVEPCILAGSRVGDRVLDPFGGSGTVGKVAIEHNRIGVLIDINPEYVKLQRERTDGLQRTLFD